MTVTLRMEHLDLTRLLRDVRALVLTVVDMTASHRNSDFESNWQSLSVVAMSLRVASFLLALCFADATLKHNKAPKQVLALDHDGQTKMLIQVQSSGTGPCDAIKCADPLTCPGGFQATKVEGHCCQRLSEGPYCVNPNIKIEPEVTGATGKAGGVVLPDHVHEGRGLANHRERHVLPKMPSLGMTSWQCPSELLPFCLSLGCLFFLGDLGGRALCFADATLKHNKAPKQVLALDHDGQTQMLIEVQSSGTGPACDAIKCADPLTCPPGFQSTKAGTEGP
eukprot:s336_g8.t1